MTLSKGFVTTSGSTALDARLIEQSLLVRNANDVPRVGHRNFKGAYQHRWDDRHYNSDGHDAVPPSRREDLPHELT